MCKLRTAEVMSVMQRFLRNCTDQSGSEHAKSEGFSILQDKYFTTEVLHPLCSLFHVIPKEWSNLCVALALLKLDRKPYPLKNVTFI